MKKFEETRRNSIDGKWYNIKRTDFVYDSKQGSYYKIWDDKVNSHCIIYDGHDCIWSINHGPLDRFGRMFDVPKYQEFIDYVGILFNIEVPTITYDTDDLVIYNITPPSEPDKHGIVKIMYQFIFNGIHGKYTQYKTSYKIENIIEYDGIRSVVIEWIEDFGLEFKDDCFPLPKYSDFARQFDSTFDIKLPTVNKPDDTKSGKVNILNEKEEKDGGNIVVTFEFEYNGIKGICERTFNPTRNSTRMMYDGQSKEWGFYNNEWDAQSSGFTNPKYKEFIKAAEKAFSISFPYIRY